MPLEIRELVIKTTVNKANNKAAGSSETGKAKEFSINEIVEKVFEILKEKSER